jgi:nicotinate-nucleotide adenylyltransferase
LGGTFDPIHHAHLRLAQEVLEQCGMSKVLLIPSGTPPHRAPPHVGAAHRLEMVRLAVRGNSALVVDGRESPRRDPCYTVDTLRELRAELGEHQPLCLLLGGDAFQLLNTWHEWRQLFELAHLVVMQRAGVPLGNAMNRADPALLAEYHARLAPSSLALSESPAGTIVVVDMPPLDISATDIRRRCAADKSIRYLVPDAVADYIKTNRLYQC